MTNMKGVISSYRRGRRTQYLDQAIILVDGIDTRGKADGLRGRKVVWEHWHTGTRIHGKVAKSHGRSGAIRVKFEKGLPGQALGKEVRIL